MTIQIDTREKPDAIKKIVAEFDKQGVLQIRSKMYVGDYMNYDNPRLVIDRKQDLLELCKNTTSDKDHKRFINEIKKAKSAGIKIIFLCEHGENIETLDDVRSWVNPRLKESPLAVSGERLYKTLYTISKTYGVEFLFCSKAETGKRIIELLS